MTEPLISTFELLAKLEARLDAECTIEAYSDFHDEITGMVSNLNCYLLDRKMHPQQKLIDAGLYNHLLLP